MIARRPLAPGECVFLSQRRGLSWKPCKLTWAAASSSVTSFARSTRTASYRFLNWMTVPYLSEATAISLYLEEMQPEPTLFGASAVERAMTMMWNAKAEQQGLWAMADAFRNTAKGLQGQALPGPDRYDQIPELAVRGRARVEAFFPKDGRAAGQQRVPGGRSLHGCRHHRAGVIRLRRADEN